MTSRWEQNLLIISDSNFKWRQKLDALDENTFYYLKYFNIFHIDKF